MNHRCCTIVELRQPGSTRLMDAGATVPRAAYEFALASALRGIEVPHYIAVHGNNDFGAESTV